jgi:hypothetical protein
MKVVQTQILNLSNNSGQVPTGQISIPYVLKDRVLLSPGVWNGLHFTKEQISLAFNNTDWNNKENFALIYDHDARASNWLGNVINRHLSEDGSIVGDLELYDEDLINKLVLGKAKLGISARVLGVENEMGEFENFTFNNFSVVYDPACKNAYINLSKNKQLEKLDSIFEELKGIIKELSGETTSVVTQGAEIENACTGQKIKYGKKKLEDDEEEEETEETTELKEVVEEKPTQSLSENLDIIERGSNMIEQKMAENEIIEESKNLETTKDVSAELSAKLDEVILSIKKLSEDLAKSFELKQNEVKSEVTETPKELEAKVEESAEVLSLRKEVQELKASSKVALSEPKVDSFSKPKTSMLLGTQLTPAENKLREVLLKNANQTN